MFELGAIHKVRTQVGGGKGQVKSVRMRTGRGEGDKLNEYVRSFTVLFQIF